MGKKFSGGPEDVGEMARRFADAILLAVTGKRGPFDTKIAFVSTRGGRFKEIYTRGSMAAVCSVSPTIPTINLFPKLARSAASCSICRTRPRRRSFTWSIVAGRTEVRIEARTAMRSAAR